MIVAKCSLTCTCQPSEQNVTICRQYDSNPTVSIFPQTQLLKVEWNYSAKSKRSLGEGRLTCAWLSAGSQIYQGCMHVTAVSCHAHSDVAGLDIAVHKVDAM